MGFLRCHFRASATRPTNQAHLPSLPRDGEAIEEAPPPKLKLPLSEIGKGERKVKGMFNSFEDMLKGERNNPKKKKEKKKKKTLLDYL